MAAANSQESVRCWRPWTTSLLRGAIAVSAIATQDYPTPAKRPAYSVLDKRSTVAALGIHPLHWRHRLRLVMEEIAVD